MNYWFIMQFGWISKALWRMKETVPKDYTLYDSDTNQGSWPSAISRNWSEAKLKIQARSYWGPCCSGGCENKQQFPLFAHLLSGQACSLCRIEVVVCVQGTDWRGGFGVLLTPLVVVSVETCAVPRFCSHHPVFAPIGIFFIFLCLVSIICPNCMHTFIFSPL